MAVSVYISNTRLRVLKAKCAGRKIKVQKAYSLELSEGAIINGIITNEEQLKEELSYLWSNYRLPKKGIRLIIDSGKNITQVMQVPYMKDRELIQYISHQLGDEPEDENIIDYFPIAKESPYELNTIFCAAIKKSVLESYLNLFRELGVKIGQINIGAASMIKFGENTNMFYGQTGIVTLVDEDTAVSVLFEDGHYLHSSRNRLLNEPGTYERMEELGQIADGIRQFQIQRHSGHPLKHFYVIGENLSTVEALRERMAPYGVETESLKSLGEAKFPPSVVTRGKHRAEEPADYLYCIGALFE